MKQARAWLTVALVLILLMPPPALSAGAAPQAQTLQAATEAPPSPATSYATQTIMIYIVGSDLERDHGLATSDMLEMIRSRFDSERINLLVMTGGAPRWHEARFSSERLGVYQIEGRSPKLLTTWELASMGEAATLSRFLDYSVAQFPAESYGLILWDHGAGPLLGFGVDLIYDQDVLLLPELREALENSPFGPDNRLEWLAFDACLMATAEVAAMAQRHSRYMIASQETLPGQGFDYSFLGGLGETGLTGPEVARAIIDSTWTYYDALMKRNPRQQLPVTLSLLDLDRVAPVRDAIDTLFKVLDQGLQLGIYSDIARDRDRTKDYGRSTTTNRYDLIDLTHFGRNLAERYPERAEALEQAIRGLVLYNRSNAPHSYGLSLYFPLRNKQGYAEGWDQLYSEVGISDSYDAFLDNFGRILLSDSLSNWTGEDAPPVVYDAVTGVYYVQLTADQVRNYEKAEYYVLARLRGEEYRLSYMSSDVLLDRDRRLYANFSGRALYLSDESGGRVIPFLRETERQGSLSTYQIPSVFTRTTTEGSYESMPGELLVEIDTVAQQARVIGAIRSDAQVGMLGKRDLDLSQWDQAVMIYQSSYLTRDKEGAPLTYGDWAASDIFQTATFDLDEKLTLQMAPLTPEDYEYFVMIAISDTQGYVYASDLMPLTLTEDTPAVASGPVAEPPRFEGEPLHLLSQEGLDITLSAIEQDSEDPGQLRLRLRAVNTLNQPRDLTASWVSLNGQVRPASLTGAVPPLDSADLILDTTLPEGGLDKLESIQLRLEIIFNRSSLFGSVTSPLIHVLSDLPLMGGGEGPVPISGRLLTRQGFVSIYQRGEPYLTEEELVVPLTIVNASQDLDLISIRESAVNGVMAPMTLIGDLPPGSRLDTEAHIALKRTILPPDLQEYQHLFDGLDNLEALQIAEPRTISLRFALDNRDSLGIDGKRSRLQFSEQVTIDFPGAEGPVPAPEKAGELIFDQADIRVTRLTEDPSGDSFLIENAGARSVYLHSWGFTKADGVDYAENIPLRALVSPGAVARAKLFDFLPGIRPQASEISFYLTLIDPDLNTLILRSEGPLSLGLPPLTIDAPETPID